MYHYYHYSIIIINVFNIKHKLGCHKISLFIRVKKVKTHEGSKPNHSIKLSMDQSI